jgi:hypothetical protein
MNLISGGFFTSVESMITEDYIDNFSKNMSQHLAAMARILNRSKLTQAVLLAAEETTFTQRFCARKLCGSQNPHVRALNVGIQRVAQLHNALVLDPRGELAGLSKNKVMRDNEHPKPWVLKIWWDGLTALCQIAKDDTWPDR